MIALWMLAATCIALLLGVAAAAAERVLRLWRRPARDAWVLAVVASLALPAGAALVSRVTLPVALTRPTTAGMRFSPRPYVLPAVVVRAADTPLVSAATLRALTSFDRPLALAWGVSSLAVVLVVGRGVWRLRRRRARWTARRVDGVSVLVTDDVGPAVVGVRAPTIVLPSWALALEAPLRALVVRHESEHVRAGDPRRLAFGAAALALMPWNPALWWQLRRLRVALEIDCDARVVGALGDAPRYGLLLLAVAQRRSTAPGQLAGAPALAESTSDLSRRITAMRTPLPARRRLRTALGAAVTAAALGATFVACSETRDAVSPSRTTAAAKAADSAKALGATLASRAAAKSWADSLRIEIDGAVTQGDSFRVGMAAITRTLAEPQAQMFKIPFSSADTAALRRVRVERRADGVPVIYDSVAAYALRGLQERGEVIARLHAQTTSSKQPAARSLGEVVVTALSNGSSAGAAQRPALLPNTETPRVISGAYFDYQVEKSVVPARGNRAPRYPDILRTAQVEGTVLAQFVVDESGRVDMATFHALRSDHALFTAAVRSALGDMQFVAAEVGGKKVKQIVVQPFQFALTAP